jgi:hypothetical protein
MVIVCNRSLFNKYGWMAFVCYFENSKGTSMTEWTPEEDEAFNMVERNSNLGKQILRANKSSGMDCCTYDCTQGRNCPVRNKTLDEVANEFSLMKSFGDTAQSFAAYVRGMKK